MRIVCISDTHGWHDRADVPEGDVLVHAGDITRHGSLKDVEDFDRWLGTLPHKHKIVICGNHDWCFQETPMEARVRLTNATYLEDSGCEIEGLKFYGSPWTPCFSDWAFMLPRGSELAAKWAQIPNGLDVLITHGPSEGILDRNRTGECCGCRDLLYRVLEVKPRLHVFGHIHEAAGRADIAGTIFLNASTQMGKGRGVVIELGNGA
ncbi:Calcineurin-like phosphoesterase superfamily domain protein [Gemmata sp. SH-PL17]|uniref:metallophosphatase domain-containing protein n=1 Tax=Gemmata sp. SH-PL17 TaxID=1630693 RepID=UPI00078B5493|nr:metallophosphatase domain-containing protein [Gemmata sp. SH-PL17]AMV23635.1 Calcineurin-like phosphoesterase superfamily domain protein [Gemmata sp. SH-PL17]